MGPVQWLKPYTDEVLVELGKKGVKSLLAVPVRYTIIFLLLLLIQALDGSIWILKRVCKYSILSKSSIPAL